MFKYSIIIPTMNEEEYLRENLQSLKKIFSSSDSFYKPEIIVVDGGSTDNTINIAYDENVKVINSNSGRGIQLNEGTKFASGDILCFLHADTFLPSNVCELLDDYFSDEKNKICRFKLSFDVDHWLLNTYKFFSKYDSQFTRFGDMFIALRKEFFIRLGGFPNWNIFEDVVFLRKASCESKVKVINAEVISSARTFTKFGLVKQQIFNGYLMMKYFLGFKEFIKANKYYRRTAINKNAIIVFARYPVEGKVKTRLATTIGVKYATKFYKKIAKHITDEIKSISNTNKYIFYSELLEKDLIKKWLGRKFFYSHQVGNDLGRRMQNAFKKVFSHGANKAIIVGTDIPDLSKEIIVKAIFDLDKYDVVIGPSKDGGYYLLGMKNNYPQLFENIEFSTETVFAKTIEKIKSLGLTYTTLKTLHDIDTEEDLIRWFSNNKRTKLKNEIELIYNLTKGRMKKRCPHCSQLELQ